MLGSLSGHVPGLTTGVPVCRQWHIPGSVTFVRDEGIGGTGRGGLEWDRDLAASALVSVQCDLLRMVVSVVEGENDDVRLALSLWLLG